MSSEIPGSGGSFTSWLAANTFVIVAGILGGIVRAITTKNISLGQRIATTVTGCIFALYGTPFASPIVRYLLEKFGAIGSADAFSNGSVEGMVGLMLGLIGFSVFDGLVTWSRQFREDPASFWPFKRK